MTGFASIAYEVLWFRLLTNFSIQSVYAFSGTSSFLFLAIVVLLLPATLIGISFPLASELTVHRINRLGQRLGSLYGLNTLGGVCGSLLTGFVLLPLLGSQMSFLVIAIASEQPLRIDVDRLRRRMSHPALQNDMAAYALGQPEQLLATFFAADEDLARFVGDVPSVTDNRPRVEYFSHYQRKQLRYDEMLKYRTPIDAYLTSSNTLDRQRIAQAVDVHTDVLFAHELRADHQYAAARRRLERAASQSPGNPYVSYLLDLLDQEQERHAASQ